jgi:DNA invertase Pin-like site-specific DNA recombinase
MHIGYARVSTDEQYTENQCEQLKKAGCELIHEENASGGRWDRPKLQDCLKHIRKARRPDWNQLTAKAVVRTMSVVRISVVPVVRIIIPVVRIIIPVVGVII